MNRIWAHAGMDFGHHGEWDNQHEGTAGANHDKGGEL